MKIVKMTTQGKSWINERQMNPHLTQSYEYDHAVAKSIDTCSSLSIFTSDTKSLNIVADIWTNKNSSDWSHVPITILYKYSG